MTDEQRLSSDASPPPVPLREPEPEPGPEPGPEPRPSGSTTEGPPSGWEGIFVPGERLLWQGQPVPGAEWGDLATDSARSAFIPMIFGLGWILLIFAMVEVVWIKLFMALFGIPFLWSGYALSFGKVRREAEELRQTWYTVSSRALYIASARKGQRKLERYPLDELPFDPQLVDGELGTIWFAERDSGIIHRTSYGRNDRRHRVVRQVRDMVGFRRLESPREVYGIILAARDALRRGEAKP